MKKNKTLKTEKKLVVKSQKIRLLSDSSLDTAAGGLLCNTTNSGPTHTQFR